VAVHVRIKDPQEFRAHIQAGGRQIDIAARSGLSHQRISQLVTGTAPRIDIKTAAQLEDGLNIQRGTLFELDGDPELIKAYLNGGDPTTESTVE
jgi:hypothetical protein